MGLLLCPHLCKWDWFATSGTAIAESMERCLVNSEGPQTADGWECGGSDLQSSNIDDLSAKFLCGQLFQVYAENLRPTNGVGKFIYGLR